MKSALFFIFCVFSIQSIAAQSSHKDGSEYFSCSFLNQEKPSFKFAIDESKSVYRGREIFPADPEETKPKDPKPPKKIDSLEGIVQGVIEGITEGIVQGMMQGMTEFLVKALWIQTEGVFIIENSQSGAVALSKPFKMEILYLKFINFSVDDSYYAIEQQTNEKGETLAIPGVLTEKDGQTYQFNCQFVETAKK